MVLFFKLIAAINFRLPSSKVRLRMKGLLIPCLFFCAQALAQDGLLQQKQVRLYQTGVALMAQRQYAAARENFNEYLATAPAPGSEQQEAIYYRGICALYLYHADAEKQLQDFIEQYPSSPKASIANAELAGFFYTEKNYKKASNYYGKADFQALTDAQQREARFRWGYSLFSQKMLKDALDQFNFVKAQGGSYGPAASYYAGFAEYNQGDYANALTDLKRAEAAPSYAPIVPYLIANTYYKQQDYSSLLTYVNAVSTRPDLANAADIALLAAEANYKRADYKNALAGYNTYLKGKEETAEKGILLRAGYAAFLLGRDDEAFTYLKNSFVDTDSIGFYSSYYLGQLYLKNNQKPMALTAFDIARKFKGDPVLVEEASFQFAKLSYETGKPDQAIAEFEKILKRFPNSLHTNEIKELLSQAYVNANNYNKAIDYIESLPSRSPAVDRAYQKATLLKGTAYFNEENYAGAVTFFEKSLQHPADKDLVAEASFWNGEAYSIGKKYEQAAVQYLRTIDESDDLGLKMKARYGLGYAYFNQQQYDRALFSFKEMATKSAANQPNLADGMLRLADCYYVQKSYTDALAFYRKAMTIKTVDPDYAHFQSGIILGILQRYDEAKTELARVVRDFSASTYADEARFQLGQQEFEQGHYEEAVKNYTGLIEGAPTSRFVPYALVRRAAANYNLKAYDATARDYITVIEKYGNHPAAKDVLLPLQEALNLAGRSGDFNQYLTAYKSSNPDAKGVEAVEFEAAKNLFFNQDYPNTIKNLTSYVASYPQSPRLSEAKYYEAESYYRLKDTDKALPLYYEVSQDATFPMAGKVTGRIAELEFKLNHYEKSIPYHMALARLATNKREQYNAWNGLMESYYYLAQYDSVEKYARLIVDNGSILAGAQNKASLFLGKAAMAKGDFETAKDEFISTVNAAQDEYGAEAKYRLAEIFYNTKDYKQCYSTLVGLNADFSSYTSWVGKSFLLMSDYFLATGDTYQTKATLQSLIDNFPLEDIKKQATEKLKNIIANEQRKQQIKSDSVGNEKK